MGSTITPVVQNFPSFQPTELYAHSGRIGALRPICVAGSKVRTYPGGRKAATPVQLNSFFPILILLSGLKDFPSHPMGILPGRLKSWLPLGSGTSSEGSGRTIRSPDRPAIFRSGWSKILPVESEKIRLGYLKPIIKICYKQNR